MTNDKLKEIIFRMREMRLPAMAEQMILLMESNELSTITSIELIDRLTESELISRKNNTIQKLKKKAKLSQPGANIREIDYSSERKLNKKVLEQLSTNDYIKKHRNVVLLGACGTGKSYICNALGNHACDECFSVLYCRLFEFLSEANTEKIMNGEATRTISRYAKPDVLIIDDFLIHEITESETAQLFKVLEYRYGQKSTIISSQVEPKEWHKNLGGYVLADSILDRILPNSYKLIMSGASLREQEEN